MDNLDHLCIGFDIWTQVGFDSEDPKFSFGARQLEKGARYGKRPHFIPYFFNPSLIGVVAIVFKSSFPIFGN